MLALFAFLSSGSQYSGQALASQTLSVAQLWLELESKSVKDVDGFIANLPKFMRSHYVLMHHSNSMQAASFKEPRVIASSPDAKLIYAFNGESSGGKFSNAIEMIEWDESNERFQFYLLDFNQSPPKLSEPNPERCASCHTAAYRPNWEDYALWSGAFGSQDDILDPDGYFNADGVYVRTAASKSEAQRFKEFVETASERPRYKHLVKLEERYRPDPSHPGIAMGHRAHGLPNTRFGVAVHQLNSRRVARILREHPNYEKMKYALALVLLDRRELALKNLDEQPKPSLIDFMNSIGYNLEAANRYAQGQYDQMPKGRAYAGGGPGIYNTPDHPAPNYVTEQARYLMERVMGLNYNELTTSPPANSYSYFQDGTGGTASILAYLVDHDPDLQRWFEITNRHSSYPNEFIERLGIEYVPVATLKEYANSISSLIQAHLDTLGRGL